MIGIEGGVEDIGPAGLRRIIGARSLILFLIELLFRRHGPGEKAGFFGSSRDIGNGPVLLGESEVEAGIDAGLVVLGIGRLARPDLGHDVGLGVIFLGFRLEPLQGLDVLIRVSGVVAGRRVHAEAVDADVRPELDDVRKLALYGVRIQIEVRHLAPETAFIIIFRPHQDIVAVSSLAAVIIVADVGALGDGRRHLVRVFKVDVRMLDEIGLGFRKPGVLAGGMVHHHVENDGNAPPVALGHEFPVVIESPEFRIDIFIIRDVVLMIGRGRADGSEPDGIAVEVVGRGGNPVADIVKLTDDALQVPDSVPVRIREGVGENLVGRHIIGCGPGPALLRRHGLDDGGIQLGRLLRRRVIRVFRIRSLDGAACREAQGQGPGQEGGQGAR